METTTYQEVLSELGPVFAARSGANDKNYEFVSENYQQLKEAGFFSAAIPVELGGGGLTHSEMCSIVRGMGHYCGSTALAFSMHQHLVAANVWKYKQGKGEGPLRKISLNQLVLVSTGAKDWLESNGSMERTEGGYLVTADKHFASQSAEGNVMVTSAVYDDGDKKVVHHFPVPFNAEGVEVLDNWYTMGMRGTGSRSIKMNKVFVPDEAVALTRDQGEFHPFWNVVITVAMPLIMSAYVGIAEKAASMATETLKKRGTASEISLLQLGEMNNFLVEAQVIYEDMVRKANDLDFTPVDQMSHDILSRKSLVAKACVKTVEKANEVVGGQSYFESFGMEKLFRDIQASAYHPLPEKQQQKFSAEFLLR